MARVGTPNLNLGTYLDGENPGAGSQTVDNTGLNGNWIKLDTAIGTEHNANGTHKNDKIDPANVKASLVDGSTLEATAATGAKVFRIKDLGVTTAKINDLAVTTGKIAALAVDSTKLKSDASVDANRAVTADHIRNAAVTEEKLFAYGVTDAKVSHDTGTRRECLHGVCKSGTTTLRLADVSVASGQGVPMSRAGFITKFLISDASGNSANASQAYTVAGGAAAGKFAAGDKIDINRNTSTGVTQPRINGTNVTSLLISTGGSATDDLYLTIEYEFDDQP